MKHFINILITLILTGFAIGIAYLQVNYEGVWFFLYLPLLIIMMLWGDQIIEKY